MKRLIALVLWVAGILVWWKLQPPWKHAGYVLIGLSIAVEVSLYFDSRRRVKQATEARDAAKRELERIEAELRRDKT